MAVSQPIKNRAQQPATHTGPPREINHFSTNQNEEVEEEKKNWEELWTVKNE